MHVSLLLLPASVTPPAIGAELDCDARLTTLHPHRVAPHLPHRLQRRTTGPPGHSCVTT
jgi:hypothetical protein